MTNIQKVIENVKMLKIGKWLVRISGSEWNRIQVRDWASDKARGKLIREGTKKQ